MGCPYSKTCMYKLPYLTPLLGFCKPTGNIVKTCVKEMLTKVPIHPDNANTEQKDKHEWIYTEK